MKNHGFCLIFLKPPKPVGERKDSLKTFGKVIRSLKNQIFHVFSRFFMIFLSNINYLMNIFWSKINGFRSES